MIRFVTDIKTSAPQSSAGIKTTIDWHLSYAPSLVRVWQQKHSEPFGDPEKMG